MKELTLTLALTTPIIFGLDLQATNIIIAFVIWIITAIKWLNEEW